MAIFVSVVFVGTASAHRSPADCSGSGLGINLYSDVVEVSIGQVITYSLDVFNGTGSGPIVCDASEITVSVTTPDGAAHAISLTRTALVNGNLDLYPNVVRYTALSANITGNGILAATANVSGTIHQNDTNSLGGGFQGLNVTVLVSTPTPTPTPTIVVIPPIVPPVVTVTTPPSGGGGGGIYVPNPEPTVAATSSVINVIVPVVPVQIPLFPNTGFAPENIYRPFNLISFFLELFLKI